MTDPIALLGDNHESTTDDRGIAFKWIENDDSKQFLVFVMMGFLDI